MDPNFDVSSLNRVERDLRIEHQNNELERAKVPRAPAECLLAELSLLKPPARTSRAFRPRLKIPTLIWSEVVDVDSHGLKFQSGHGVIDLGRNGVDAGR